MPKHSADRDLLTPQEQRCQLAERLFREGALAAEPTGSKRLPSPERLERAIVKAFLEGRFQVCQLWALATIQGGYKPRLTATLESRVSEAIPKDAEHRVTNVEVAALLGVSEDQIKSKVTGESELSAPAWSALICRHSSRLSGRWPSLEVRRAMAIARALVVARFSTIQEKPLNDTLGVPNQAVLLDESTAILPVVLIVTILLKAHTSEVDPNRPIAAQYAQQQLESAIQLTQTLVHDLPRSLVGAFARDADEDLSRTSSDTRDRDSSDARRPPKAPAHHSSVSKAAFTNAAYAIFSQLASETGATTEAAIDQLISQCISVILIMSELWNEDNGPIFS